METLVFFCLVLSVLALSQSKISTHSGGALPLTSKFVSQARPRILKILDGFGADPTTLKNLNPGMRIVGRIYQAAQPQDGDPQQRAKEWWDAVQSTIMSSPGVDWWEGYNEPDISTLAKMQWYAQFEMARVGILAQNGKKASIGQFATGCPDITTPSIPAAFLPAIKVALANQGVLGLHEYNSPVLANCFDNSTSEGWMTGRYRKWYREQLLPANLSIPLIISEFGIDNSPCGSPNLGGWLAYCQKVWQLTQPACSDYYVDMIAWYDGLLREDSYVLGATIFQLEIPNWDDYSIASALDPLISYMNSRTACCSENVFVLNASYVRIHANRSVTSSRFVQDV